MNELETELRGLFQAKVDDAERPVNLLPGVRRRASRTMHRRVGAGALAGVAVIAAAVLPTVVHLPASSPRGPISGHKAPRGWIPVDYGSAQIWVPPSWPIDSTGGCVGSQPAGVMYGNTPKKDCALPRNVLQIVSPVIDPGLNRWVIAPRRHAHARRLEINGLAVKVKPAVGPGLFVDVPGLAVRLVARGPVAIRAVGTLRRSLAAGARPEARDTVPAGFRWYEFGGIKFAAPAAWPDHQRGPLGEACAPIVEPGAVELSSSEPIGGLLCAGFATVHAGYLAHRSGVIVISLHATHGPASHRLPPGSCARSYRRVGQFCVQELDGFNTQIALYLYRPGQKKLSTMYVGLGGGEVARAIIDSIRPAPGH